MREGTFISLKSLMGKVGDNKLMMKYFSERSYIMRVIIHTLKAIEHLNSKGHCHGDINPANIIIRFNSDNIDSFRTQMVEGLHIKQLVEIAMKEQGLKDDKIITRYDPPERKTMDQDYQVNWDIWALGQVIFECLVCLKHGYLEDEDQLVNLNLSELSEEGRIALVKSIITDPVYQELLIKMLSDHRPKAHDLFSNNPTIRYYSFQLEERTDVRIDEFSHSPDFAPILVSAM